MPAKHTAIASALLLLGFILIGSFGYGAITDFFNRPVQYDFEGITRPVRYQESPTKGAEDAAVTLFEYADFTCPACAQAQGAVNQLMAAYGDRVLHVFKDLPFRSVYSVQSAVAARCAGEQGAYWEYHDWLFTNQSDAKTPDLSGAAQLLGLDLAQFDACTLDPDIEELVNRDYAEARALGLDETPTFVVGGIAQVGPPAYDELERLVLNELNRSK